MSRIIYSASKRDFNLDVINHCFTDKMEQSAILNHIGHGFAETNSWKINGYEISHLLDQSHVPDDIIVAFEYKVPNGGRIDCMLYGRGRNNKNNVVHIELKQWSNDSVVELYDNGVFEVEALTGNAYRAVPHPCQQVQNYQSHLKNYIVTFNEPDCNLEGLAYCYNYKTNRKPNALLAQQYSPILQHHELYCGDQIEALSQKLNDLLCYGKGLEIFNRVIDSPVKPTKVLLNAVANMFKGITEYALLDDQLAASNAIHAEIEKALRHPKQKTAIIIKGGPGTGKSVIALHILSQLAAKEGTDKIFFTTRSKALRENLKLKLKNIGTNHGKNASDIITDIFDYKPRNFKENEVQALLIDEAHRIGNSSNFMTDRVEETTFLSQTMSLLYCSRVCVFFIDDKQAIKTSEIGSSQSIRHIAEHYKEILQKEKQEFLAKIERKKTSYAKKVIEERELRKKQSILPPKEFQSKYNKLKEQLVTLNKDISKERCVLDVSSSFNGKIKIIEMELKSQFRCNGSDNYLDWLDEILYKNVDDVRTHFSRKDYEFEIFDSPFTLYDKIRSLDSTKKNSARLAAGYCWKWSTQLEPNGDLKKDVVIGDFRMPWETNNVRAKNQFRNKYASSADTWAIEPEGINQIGCVFSIQGLEIDYIGVIIGPDLQYDPIKKCLYAVPGKNIDQKTGSNFEEYDRHVKNIYRVLMSRGKKGCFIYCCNESVKQFFSSFFSEANNRFSLK